MLEAGWRDPNSKTEVIGKVVPMLDMLELSSHEYEAVDAGPDEAAPLDGALELATEALRRISPRCPDWSRPLNAICDMQHGMRH
jgi:hypothetical protein